eukprot:TRINITY_DN36881_c0_g1_i1.p1 TRINITY_DN36881_c0_g1~~TRINITY_DN36881_c0_g1_i1.p1  ORF type:complete len:295 (-),score=44.78 TRINITY_DN36881_c0_g1_i1:146-1030(-)
MTMLRVLITLALFAQAVVSASNPSVVAFSVPTSGSHNHFVELETTRGITTCTLAYTTGAVEAAKPVEVVKETAPGRISEQQFWDQMNAACVRHNVNNWKYDICPGKSVDQDTGETYNLGRYSETIKNKQFFRNGHTCGDVPRQTTVEYVCKEQAVKPTVTSLEETSRCVYNVVIMAQLACRAGFPDSPSVRIAPVQPAGPVNEGWFMEIVEEYSGDIRCSIQNIGQQDSRSGSHVQFSDIKLSLTNTIHQVVCLHNERIPCDAGEFGIATEDKTSVVKSTSSFSGNLEYLEIST